MGFDADEGTHFRTTCHVARFVLAAMSNRYARVCLEESIKYAKKRTTFGAKLSSHQVIQHKIAGKVASCGGGVASAGLALGCGLCDGPEESTNDVCVFVSPYFCVHASTYAFRNFSYVFFFSCFCVSFFCSAKIWRARWRRRTLFSNKSRTKSTRSVLWLVIVETRP